MQVLKTSSVFFLLTIFLASCSKEPNIVLPSSGGTWIIEAYIVTTYVGGKEVNEDRKMNHGEMFFEEDGDGRKDIYDGNSVPFTWKYSDLKKEMSIIESGVTMVFEVEDSQRKFQTWKHVAGDVKADGMITLYYMKRK